MPFVDPKGTAINSGFFRRLILEPGFKESIEFDVVKNAGGPSSNRADEKNGHEGLKSENYQGVSLASLHINIIAIISESRCQVCDLNTDESEILYNPGVSDRYSRQVLFSGIGKTGQERIRAARVVVIGCGALGTVNAEMLARAGVGSLTIIDRDFVEESNLQRQGLFAEQDARDGLPKAVAAERALKAINSEVLVRGLVEDVTHENIEALCRGADVIVDGTDNFETRYLINDFCVKHAVPWIYGACLGSYGIAFAFRPGLTPCLRCLFEQPPAAGEVETCDTAGILAPAVHAVAAFQTTQVLKLLVGESTAGEIFHIDVWKGTAGTLRVGGKRTEECPCCNERRFSFLEGKEKDRLTRLCGRDAVQVWPRRTGRVDFQELAKRLERTGKVRFNEYMMRIQINGYEIALFPDGRSIIKGTDDFAEARAVYAKYIGS